jgi:hypothetical protein
MLKQHLLEHLWVENYQKKKDFIQPQLLDA